MSQVLSPPQLDVSKSIQDCFPRQKLPSFFTDLGGLVPMTTSPTHSDSPPGSVDDDHSSLHSPIRSFGQFQYGSRPTAAVSESPATSPTTDMFDPDSRSPFAVAPYPAPHPLSIDDTSASTIRNPDAIGSYLSESPSPVDIHRPPSFPHPVSAPPSQDRFPLTGAPSYSGDDRTVSGSLTDRCTRQGSHDKYSTTCAQPGPGLEQRRMSEPTLLGCHSPYGPPCDSSEHMSQYPFAFNPPPQPVPQPIRSSSYLPGLERGPLRGARALSDYPLPQSNWKQGDDTYEPGLYEPLSPLNPNFHGGLLASPNGVPYPPSPGDQYGPSPPNTATSTSSASQLGSMNYSHFGPQPEAPNLQRGAQTNANLAGDATNKTYSFVALHGNTVKKRPRRRYDEIHRLYFCVWPGCDKGYGTLNHLNAHILMQKHGFKRTPAGKCRPTITAQRFTSACNRI